MRQSYLVTRMLLLICKKIMVTINGMIDLVVYESCLA